MAVVISGTNNSDKITATDGLIDLLSSVNFASEVTVPSFKVGSDIQIGNAGIITATTLVGNVQGNINHTSNLLLQISGSEKFRVGTSGQLGIGGANYGTSGQVLTSGGSSSAATWSTISGTTINNNAANKVIMGSNTANTLEAVAKSSLFSQINHGQSFLDDNYLIFGDASDLQLVHQSSGAKARIRNTNDSGSLDIESTLTRFLNKDGSTEKLRIASNGQVSISSDGTTDGLLTIKGNSDQVSTPSIRLLDGSDTREVSISNTSGDFVASVHGNDNAIHGHIKMFESGQIDFNNGGASGSNTNRLRIDTSGRVGINRTPALASSKLEVGGADNYPLINVEASGATGGMGIGGAALKFFYGTSEKLLIHSDGQIQAGTSAPTYLKYTGSAVATNNNNATLLGSNNIGLIGQYSSLNMPFDHSTATASGAWWMLGRSAGTTNEWGLYTRSGGQSNLLSVWKVIANSNGTTNYQTFSTGSNSESLRLTSNVLQLNNAGSTFRGKAYGSNNFEIRGTGSNNNLEIVANANQENVTDAHIILKSSRAGSSAVERAVFHNWGGLELRQIRLPYASSEQASRHVYAFHKSGTYSNFYVDVGFNGPGGFTVEMKMGGYNNRHMHWTYNGYVYGGSVFASVGAIDSGNGPQRSISNQGNYGNYGTKMRFGFSSMSSTHTVVEMDISYGPAGGNSIAQITGAGWS